MTIQAVAQHAISELVTLLLPVKSRSLIIPNVTVAEIIQLDEVRPAPGAPGWLLGWSAWRGLQIPVVCFDGLNEDPFATTDPLRRAAVVNGCSDPGRLPFYAISTAATPRMMRLGRAEILACEGASIGPAERMVVNASGEEASLPDLEYIESKLLEQLAS